MKAVDGYHLLVARCMSMKHALASREFLLLFLFRWMLSTGDKKSNIRRDQEGGNWKTLVPRWKYTATGPRGAWVRLMCFFRSPLIYIQQRRNLIFKGRGWFKAVANARQNLFGILFWCKCIWKWTKRLQFFQISRCGKNKPFFSCSGMGYATSLVESWCWKYFYRCEKLEMQV